MSTLGQAAGGIVGGIIGFMVGGPVGFKYGAQIGLMLGGYLDPPKGPVHVGPRLEDLSVQTSTYGTFIPRVYGTVAITGNLIWLQNNELTETKSVSQQGGKGGAPTSTTVTYSYSGTFAVALCKGPIAGIKKIWIGADLWYNANASQPGAVQRSAEAAEIFTLYYGTEDQEPDPLIQADRGVADTPAYRGIAYIVFDNLPLEKWGNSLAGAQIRVEVVKSGETSGALIKLNEVVSDWESVNDVYMTEMAGTVWMGDHAYDIDTLDSVWQNIPLTYDYPSYGLTGLERGGCRSAYCAIQDSTATNKGALVYVNPVSGYGEVIDWGDPASIGDLQDVFPTAWPGHPIFATYTGTNPSYYGRVYKWEQESLTYYTAISCKFTSIQGRARDGVYKLYLVSTDDAYIRVIDAVSMSLITTVGINMLPGYRSVFKYDEELDLLVVIAHNNSGWAVIDCSTDTLVQSQTNLTPPFSLGHGFCYDDVKHRLWFTDSIGAALYYVSMTDYQTYQDESFPGMDGIVGPGMADSRGRLWLMGYDSSDGKYYYYVYVPGARSITTSPEVLGDIVKSECLLSGLLDDADVDTTELTDEVRGYRVSSAGSIRSGVEPLMAVWPFDVRQHGYQIQFVRRGQHSSIATIDGSELDARPAGASSGPRLVVEREMDSMLPRAVTVKYFDATREYDVNEQSAARENTDAVNLLVIDVPIVLTAKEAIRAATALLYLYWQNRYGFSLNCPPDYLHLEPADIITVTDEGSEHELLLGSVSYLPDGRLELKAHPNSASVYVQESEADEGSSTGSDIQTEGPTAYYLMDIPLLIDSMDAPCFVLAMGGFLADWRAGSLFRSADDGQSWSNLTSVVRPGATIGYAVNSLSEHDGCVIDYSSLLSVRMLAEAELSSVTEAQMFAGSNWFAYGADGRWEIIAARNAVLQGDGSYVLSDFLRGQFGTEWATGLHVYGDVVVMLEANNLELVSATLSMIGVENQYKGVSVGRDLTSVDAREFTYEGVNLMCLSPVHITGTRHPTTRDWSISWTRRSRFGAWRNYVDAPIGEDTESYTVEIYDADDYANLVRSISATSESVAYTSAQQVTDFGSNQGTLYLKIYQNSADVGAGYATYTELTRS